MHKTYKKLRGIPKKSAKILYNLHKIQLRNPKKSYVISFFTILC